MPSIYCPELTNDSQEVTIQDDEFHHLTHVLRHKIGDIVKLNNGKGILGKGTITDISKKYASIEIMELTYSPPNQNTFSIAFSLLRNKNDEWLVEKVTEFGVKDLFPLTTDFSVRTPSKNTITRFSNTALSAIKQCDNPYLPTIHNVMPFSQAIDYIISMGYTIVVASEQKPDKKIIDLPKGLSYCFVIGPEGGFSAEEFSYFRKKGFVEVSISNLVLRAETAAIAIAAQYNITSTK
jgi:16S rRNA (uracil1498-N3)-methyltransferase